MTPAAVQRSSSEVQVSIERSGPSAFSPPIAYTMSSITTTAGPTRAICIGAATTAGRSDGEGGGGAGTGAGVLRLGPVGSSLRTTGAGAAIGATARGRGAGARPHA